MATRSMTGKRGALVLGIAWLVALAAGGSLIAWVEFFPHPAILDDVISLPMPGFRQEAKLVVKAPPPLPLVFETPPGGIVPAELSASEKAALKALPPPQQQPVADTALPAANAPPLEGGPGVANPAMLEKTAEGYLPRISDSGLWPLRGYAVPIASGNRPKIAIVVSGLGISAKATEAAITMLPPGVTLAFAPYAGDVQHWVILARQKGHEVLLQAPMEPFDFPDSDPGQYTLRTAAGEEANIKKLNWALTRFTGYVGVTNLLGGRFLSDSNGIEPVLTYLMRRGVMFYDNGAAPRSVAKDVAVRLGSPFVQATLTIDSIQASMEIDHRLSDLETEARTKGVAVGSASLYPVTIERLAAWAKGLSGRGFVLAPISAIVPAEKK